MTPTRRATYRLQLGPGFTFADASAAVPYLAALGVSHVYLSPIAEAVPASPHGYDVVDPTRVRAELGGDRGLRDLSEAAAAEGLGLLLDVVPNHVAADARNPWWWRTLAGGSADAAARWFDVDWQAPGADGRIVLPVLEGPTADVIATGALRLSTHDGEAVVAYHDHRFPATGAVVGDEIDAVLDRQHYRLVDWRAGPELVNYRRFFAIASLPAVRVEDPDVFAAVTGLPVALCRSGVVDGLRLDHVDGLSDPGGFLEALHAALPDAWLLVEKILEADERLPASWPVAGTTGYEHAEAVTGVLVDPAGDARLTAAYQDFTGSSESWSRIVRTARLAVVDALFPADLRRVARAVGPVLGVPVEDVVPMVRSLLAELPGYRTYIGPGPADPADAARIAGAAERAGDATHVLAAMLVRADPTATDARTRVEQLATAVAAKGIEDTAMYRYNRLLCRNEVGSDPGRFALTVAALHERNAATGADAPETLRALSTHDTKRSADVRARIAVLSEVADEFATAAHDWSERAATATGSRLEPALAWFACQTVLGAWPIDADRLGAVLRKSAREASTRTSWAEPDLDYETTIGAWAAFLAADAAVASFARRILVPGRVNALAQTLLHLTAPGIPDTYQGDELWNLGLTDPDNRRPVDLAARAALLEELAATGPPTTALAEPDDPGRPKLWVVHRSLALRRAHPEWFGRGASYEPLAASGPDADRVIAFARADRACTIVTRFPMRGPAGGGTSIRPPVGPWHNVLDGEHYDGGSLPLDRVLARFPVALLASTTDEQHRRPG